MFVRVALLAALAAAAAPCPKGVLKNVCIRCNADPSCTILRNVVPTGSSAQMAAK